ncbi:hypothetical protein WANA31_0456 [Wolbachia endosymbiont of Drosophila ananassae]|nr:hypothetical protein WANA13_1062 [Wolbachia endosymbiont of Drosophila ananassae]RLT61720.1 hypothetical protein WANA31_0456 [Wolbachia endosymbiont of Drosophila ananassae]
MFAVKFFSRERQILKKLIKEFIRNNLILKVSLSVAVSSNENSCILLSILLERIVLILIVSLENALLMFLDFSLKSLGKSSILYLFLVSVLLLCIVDTANSSTQR